MDMTQSPVMNVIPGGKLRQTAGEIIFIPRFQLGMQKSNIAQSFVRNGERIMHSPGFETAAVRLAEDSGRRFPLPVFYFQAFRLFRAEYPDIAGQIEKLPLFP